MRIDSEKIKMEYGKRQLSQGEFANEARLSKQGLNAILAKASCSPASLIKIADALEVEPEELLKE